MKALVFGGSGKMGSSVAWELARRDDVTEIGLVDRRGDALEMTQRWIGSPKVRLECIDLLDDGALREVIGRYDVGVATLPNRRLSYRVASFAIRGGLPMVDLLEEYHRRPDRYETEGLELPEGVSLHDYGDWLHEKALENGVMFLSGIGFAPGLSNVTTGEGMRKLDRATRAIARVGGIPDKEAAARHPLRYVITWSFEHVLREYMVKVDVIKGGKVVEVDATSDFERFRFNRFGHDEILEAAVTPGMPSFIFTRPELEEFAEKTVRWPGHWEGVQTLKECGLLDLAPVDVHGKSVVPREFLSTLLTPRLRPGQGETDSCVMWNSVEGEKDGKPARVDYYLWDEGDLQSGISSMGRVTGFSAAIAAWMLGSGMLTETGIVAPEDAIYGDRYGIFMAELEKHGVKVLEEVSAG